MLLCVRYIVYEKCTTRALHRCSSCVCVRRCRPAVRFHIVQASYTDDRVWSSFVQQMKEPLLHIIVTNIIHHLILRAWSNILQTVHVHTSFMHIYISFTLTLALQPADSILLSDLGPLHLWIPQFPLELLVRDPVVEDRPATVRSNLKKGSIYMNETKHNWWQ